MSFFNKLNQFRETGVSDFSANEQLPAVQKGEASQPEEDHDVSIRDLWQQAVNIHKEKLNATTEAEGEQVTTLDDQGEMDNSQVSDVAPASEWIAPLEPALPKEESNVIHEGQSPREELDVPIVSLAQITVDELRKQADQTLENIYDQRRIQLKSLFGKDLPYLTLEELKQTQFGQDLDLIVQVYMKNGRAYPQAKFAVQRVLAALWKPAGEEEFRVPEPWYQTPLGFVCRHILAGQSATLFDPIDLETAASILEQTQRSIIENYPRLGGVRLATGYVFSRQRIEEQKQQMQADIPLVAHDMLKQFYLNSSLALKKLITIRSFMDEAHDQVRYLRELLVYNIDFGQNRIRQAIKGQTEKCLADLYQSFLELRGEAIEKVQINKNDYLHYHIPNIFSAIDGLEGRVINGDAFIHSLEETVKSMDDERVRVNRLIEELAKNLGYLNMELEKGKL
ncbi:hypothetical protein [Ammoniphilus sp. 3BR4]|uniref:hypothetical protein n=1 Tax=Ammoniphilus sp. 3BR4 TaxID=3158265 RepID=UPI0034662B89